MMRKLIWILRASLCEELFNLSLKIAPEDYVPSFVAVALSAHRGGLSKAGEKS